MKRRNEKTGTSEQASAALDRMYEHFFNLSSDMLCIAGLDGYFKHLNPAFEKTLGYTTAELCSKPYNEFVHPDDRLAECAELQHRAENSSAVCCVKRYLCKNGTYKWLSWTDHTDIEKGMIYAVARDITDQKHAEEALQKARDELELRVRERTSELTKSNEELIAEIEEREKIGRALMESEGKYRKLSQEFNVLLNAIPDSLVLLSYDMKILWANEAAASVHGRKASDLTGLDYFSLSQNIIPSKDSHPSIRSFLSGKGESAEISSRDGKIWDIRTFPLTDDTGTVNSVIELSREITAQVQMEIEARRMQGKLIHANKMSALGTLVSGIAHEINNPNSFIMSNAELLTEIWEELRERIEENKGKGLVRSGEKAALSELGEDMTKLVTGINEGALRIRSIIDNLRDLARPDRSRVDEKVDINRIITASRTILGSLIKKSTDNFRVRCSKSIPYAKGNAQQIEQVIINILMNSLQALPDRSCGVSVSTSFSKKTDSVIIKVKDQGTGMSRDTYEKIREPFFTTKFDSGGTGLGLSISYDIIKRHQGTLDFESEPGAGTTAIIKLPAQRSGQQLHTQR